MIVQPNKDLNYPFLLIPDSLKRQLEKNIPIPVDEPKEPQKPYKKDTDVIGCALVPLPFIFIIVVIAEIPLDGIIFIFMILGGAVLIQWIKNINEANDKYAIDIENYKLKYREYERQLAEYENLANEIRTPEETKKYRKRMVLESLKSVDTPNNNYMSKKGRSERYFEQFLNRWFAENIISDCSLYISDKHQPFQPDFTYIDEDNLHIDIEIDEPYLIESSEPIHYLDENGMSIDYSRDEFFIRTGWIVMRFAEEQVVRYPNECCKKIAEVISNITGNQKFLNSLIKFNELKVVEKWTYDEAKTMAKRNYRFQYLQKLSAAP